MEQQISLGEQILNLGNEGGRSFTPADGITEAALVQRATDPVILPQPYSTPGDFAAQYPTPLDPMEVIAMCEEVSVYRAIPEEETALLAHTWRELNELAFTSGSAYISFAEGECPEEYEHDGDNTTVNLKNIGAKKTLSLSQIMHSRAVASANWHGINRLLGPVTTGEGMPGGAQTGTFEQEFVADLREKEMRLAMTLVLNGWDNLLVNGDVTNNSLEFDGIVNRLGDQTCSAHTNVNTASGTFSAISYDRFLTEGCAKPTTIFGSPQAIQEVMSAYFQLGYQGSQVVNFNTGDRIVPGYNFAAYVNTGVGRLAVVADDNFTNTDMGNGAFQSILYGLRMSHNGTPLVYKLTQIPLAVKDLVPGCTAISFQIWAKTSLIIKHCCAHSAYTSQFTGRVATTCPTIG